jgi:hypothetical protein
MAVVATERAYTIEGRLLEVCACCHGRCCDSVLGWRVDRGTIDGVEVAGLTLALSVAIPGDVLSGNWQAIVYVDDDATDEQAAALLGVFTERLAFAGLIGEVVEVRRVPFRDTGAIQGDFHFEG